MTNVPIRLLSHQDPPSTTTVPPPALAPSLLHPQPVTIHPPPLPTHRHTQVRIPRPHRNGHIMPFHFSDNILRFFGLQHGPLLFHFGSTTMSSTSSSLPNTRHSAATATRSTCLISATPTTTRTSTHRSTGHPTHHRHPADCAPRGCCSGYQHVR